MMKSNKLIYRLIISVGVLVLAPVIVFVFVFWNQSFSNDISDWANFGSYIGGIVGAMISLVSLVVLGYITWLVSKQTNKESKALYVNQKRLEIHIELANYLPKLHMSYELIKTTFTHLLECITSCKSFSSEKSSDINIAHDTFKEFYYYILHFESMYGILFDYDFRSDEFKNFVDELINMNSFFENVKECATGGKTKLNNKVLESVKTNLFIKEYVKFIDKLESEISI